MVKYGDFPPIPEEMRPQIDAYWASFLGCRPALLYPPQAVTLWAENSPGLIGLQTARDWLFAFHPGVTVGAATALLDGLLPLLGSTLACATHGSPHAVQHQLRLRAFDDTYGPAYVLYCPAVIRPPRCARPIHPLPIHHLDEADQSFVEQFQQGMGSVVWQLDQPTIWPRVCGIFQDGQLVAAGAVRCWGNKIGEIFVDTLPQYRNRGYAKALASDLTEWVLRETAWLPQYDAEIHNLPSLRVAHAVGYAYYGMLLWGTLVAQPSEQ